MKVSLIPRVNNVSQGRLAMMTYVTAESGLKRLLDGDGEYYLGMN